MDSSLRLVLFLGLIKQYIKQITTSLEQPEDREQLAMMKFLRQTNEGRSMEWPYLRWNQERQLRLPWLLCPHGPDDGPGHTGKLHFGAWSSFHTQTGGKSPVTGGLSGFDRTSGPQKPAVLQGTVLAMLQRQLPASQAPSPPSQDGAPASGEGFGGTLPATGNGYGQGQTGQGTRPGQGAEDEPLEAGTADPTSSQIPSDPSRADSAGSGGGHGKGGCRDHQELSWTLLRGCSRPSLRLSLRNPGNLCHVHAILQMFIWFSMIHDTYLDRACFLGRLQEPFGHLRQ